VERAAELGQGQLTWILSYRIIKYIEIYRNITILPILPGWWLKNHQWEGLSHIFWIINKNLPILRISITHDGSMVLVYMLT
jgi:hypothetical protein